MYKIMLADDEGIVIESLKRIIEKNFGESCEIRAAKTGRAVIELAEEFRPDIAFMDIQMPGINGIEAMKEIKKFNNSTIFIVMSAYDKFVYAKEAINLGVMEYLTKPANQGRIVETIEKAMKIVDGEKEKRRRDLRTKEKLETVIPIIESGLIYTILCRDDYTDEAENFKELLSIESDYGFVLVVQYGDINERGDLGNPVGASVKAQSFYLEFREIVKEFFPAIIGPAMVNQIVIFIPWDQPKMEYNERIQTIEKSRNLVRKLMRRIELNFRIGIGSVKPLDELVVSYKEAARVMRLNRGKVVHISDTVSEAGQARDFLAELEDILVQYIRRGDLGRVKGEADACFDLMEEQAEKYGTDIRTKALSFLLRIENELFQGIRRDCDFIGGNDVLETVMAYQDTSKLRTWFLEKVTEICRNVLTGREEKSDSIISKAKSYILENYHKDISLDDVSREADISPYYFSKLFKEEAGENFIEYLTKIRIDKAKQLLNNKELSIKEICVAVGYGDPNYFSRIFKKYSGRTPTEYREGIL